MPSARILIVEDEAVVRLDLQSKVERLGYEVVKAVGEAEEAVKYSMRLAPDLVLMDVQLKGEKDGIETAAEIQALVDIPIIYITAHADSGTLERAKVTAPFGYIVKPFHMQNLAVMIEMALNKHSLEQKLRQSEARYRAVVEDQDDLIVRFSKDKKVVFVNSAYCHFKGKTQEELVGKQLPMDIVFKDDLGRVEDILSGISVEMPAIINENRNVNAMGELRWMHWTDRGIFDERGRLLEYQCVAHDITELKRAEAAILESQKLAHLGTLAAGIAHEMNSPLQVITGTSDSLLKRLSGKRNLGKQETRRGLDAISRNGWRLAGIVRALLTYARSSSEQTERHNLNEIVNRALLLLDARLKEAPGIGVETHLMKAMPACICDDRQIIQVLINLVTNALEAMPEGGQITLSSSYDADNNQLVLEVSDTGKGIPEDIQARIFDPFFTTKPVGTGIGLGLSVVMGIIKAHNGTIHVRSSPGHGAVFTVNLPLGSIDPQGLQGAEIKLAGRYDDRV